MEDAFFGESGVMREARIHLTFDDGPDPVWTPRILEELRLAGAKATFFAVAPLAMRFPEIVHRTREEGHEIALHCESHIRHTELSREEVERDTESGLRSLESLGIHPGLWRPPWGILAPWTKSVAEDFGLEICLWDADTHDWRGDAFEAMLDSISPSLSPGDTVLMHDGLGPGATRGGCAETARLIPPLVSRIRDLGCEPTMVSTKEPRRVGA